MSAFLWLHFFAMKALLQAWYGQDGSVDFFGKFFLWVLVILVSKWRKLQKCWHQHKKIKKCFFRKMTSLCDAFSDLKFFQFLGYPGFTFISRPSDLFRHPTFFSKLQWCPLLSSIVENSPAKGSTYLNFCLIMFCCHTSYNQLASKNNVHE